MIVFDLRCGQGHVFEAWFGSSAAYEEQRAGGLLACPMCGDGDVGKALMAPNVATKGNRKSDAAAPQQEVASPRPAETPAVPPALDEAPSPKVVKAALQTLAQMQARALENSQWVGRSFASRARAMHDGEEDHAPIHGQATAEEAREMIEDGLAVAPLPFPVVPPEARN
ncbi:DUF1178 family protein [Stakelama tenebrarum]|uniref:DUF1178 family protein n=1 Tax=Stakelama tenebrarum TaxID=2711215 RepID=A0A6G6Y7U5_9SPHN|nr:DUF1178 family protein [Sphingosinithalassobacter tenebrarum]QIG81014.1 DUF1178 family protein [Sphingosinithalassobacter tenebrarum]